MTSLDFLLLDDSESHKFKVGQKVYFKSEIPRGNPNRPAEITRQWPYSSSDQPFYRIFVQTRPYGEGFGINAYEYQLTPRT